MSVSPPEVVYKTERGQRLEPLEEVICEVDEKEAGAVIEVRPILATLPTHPPIPSGC